MDNTIKPPVYSKLTQILLGLIAFFFILYIGQQIIIPLVFATILAILLNPVVNYLTSKKINRVLAIFIALTAAIVVIGAIGYFIVSEALMFADALPQLKQKLDVLFADLQSWISGTFHVKKWEAKQWVEKMKSDGLDNGPTMLGDTIKTISGVLIVLLLLPVYIFFILFYKPHLLEFIARLFKRQEHSKVAEVLMQTRLLIQSYLAGLLAEAALVAILNTTALFILGIQYALLIGVIGALLNVIPYIGGLVAIAIPMIMAFATQTPATALWVFVAYSIVQFIDNHIIVPGIVASKVKLNGLASIIAVLTGGALWGIPGMFLSIPLTSIMKVIFDRIEALEPFGFLIGDEEQQVDKTFFKFKFPGKKK